LNKEDLIGERTGNGRFMFRFYQDLIRFVIAQPAARSRAIDVIYRHNDNRVIAFTRSVVTQKLLILASLNDSSFSSGYIISTDSCGFRQAAGGRSSIVTLQYMVETTSGTAAPRCRLTAAKSTP
jgi:glycosidase